MFLSLVHLRDLACVTCGAPLARAGARSLIVDADGMPVGFSKDDQPAEMTVQFLCPNGHDTECFVPNEIGAEETLRTPNKAPLGTDAVLLSGKTEVGRDV